MNSMTSKLIILTFLIGIRSTSLFASSGCELDGCKPGPDPCASLRKAVVDARQKVTSAEATLKRLKEARDKAREDWAAAKAEYERVCPTKFANQTKPECPGLLAEAKRLAEIYKEAKAKVPPQETVVFNAKQYLAEAEQALKDCLEKT